MLCRLIYKEMQRASQNSAVHRTAGPKKVFWKASLRVGHIPASPKGGAAKLRRRGRGTKHPKTASREIYKGNLPELHI